MIKKIIKKISLNNATRDLKFHKSEDTLNSIKKAIQANLHGAYLRFGDGDINLAIGKDDLLQPSNKKLSIEMQETLALSGLGILKALPLHCKEYGLDDGMFPGNHECDKTWADDMLYKAAPYWGGKINEVYSPVALHFLASYKPKIALDFLKYMKSKNPLCIIGNENTPKLVVSALFGSQCKHIKTSPQNSYENIDSYEAEFDYLMKSNRSKYNIVIVAMGCSGRVLQKRLFLKYDNLFLFDFGSLLDALCGWDTRAWMKLSSFDKDSFLKKLK